MHPTCMIEGAEVMIPGNTTECTFQKGKTPAIPNTSHLMLKNMSHIHLLNNIHTSHVAFLCQTLSEWRTCRTGLRDLHLRLPLGYGAHRLLSDGPKKRCSAVSGSAFLGGWTVWYHMSSSIYIICFQGSRLNFQGWNLEVRGLKLGGGSLNWKVDGKNMKGNQCRMLIPVAWDSFSSTWIFFYRRSMRGPAYMHYLVSSYFHCSFKSLIQGHQKISESHTRRWVCVTIMCCLHVPKSNDKPWNTWPIACLTAHVAVCSSSHHPFR